MLKVEGFDDINVAALPLVRMEESSHVHHSTPEMCLRAHGFFDVEQRVCRTLHRLASVCVKLDFNKQDKEWHVEPPLFTSEGDPIN